MGYLWSCVVSLFQIIFVVNSGGYRGIYGSNPLKPPPKPMRNKPSNVEKVKFFSSPTNVEKLKSSPESKNHRPYPTGLNNSQRLKDDYLEMRRKYLKKSGFDIGHGQTNSRFWNSFNISVRFQLLDYHVSECRKRTISESGSYAT